MQKIIIGARGSQLSLKQTDIVKNLLQKLVPSASIEIKIITTTGDKNKSSIPLDTIGKGWFTKEIDKELLEENIDLAVHSLKDLPEILPPGLIIAAIPEREDAREALISKNGETLAELKKNAIIGTDSSRRKIQILQRRENLIVKSIRGNVPPRLEKLDHGEYDAIFLAVAGLKRLGLEKRITQYFDPEDFIPSPGQGALAVVIKKNNTELRTILRKLNHKATVATIKAERAFSKAVGGGCKMPVGAYATYKGNTIHLYAMIGSLDGEHMVKDAMTGSCTKPAELGKMLATSILAKCKPWYKK